MGSISLNIYYKPSDPAPSTKRVHYCFKTDSTYTFQQEWTILLDLEKRFVKRKISQS